MPTTCLYIDGCAGVAGNMILGALVDLGVDPEGIRDALRPIVPVPFELRTERVEKHGVGALHLTVAATDDKSHHHLPELLGLLKRGDLTEGVRRQSEAVYRRLAAAEAKIHGKSPETVHFHEVGAADAIVDIAGSLLALEQLKVERIYCSPLTLGAGRGRSAHGAIVYPAPATIEILRGVPARFDRDIGETTTPTGAAIMAEVATFVDQLPLTIDRVGYGAGTADFDDRPNLLRATLGTTTVNFEHDDILVGVSTIDNTRPEVYDWLAERLLAAGAVDVVLTPAMMKKNRPGVRLEVLGPPEKRGALSDVIVRETNTLGVRWSRWERDKLPRTIENIQTRWGTVRIKVAIVDGRRRGVPEYDDCRRIAEQTGTPVALVIEEASAAFRHAKSDSD